MTFTTARGEETTSVRGVSATSAAGSAGVTETAKSLEENISLVHPDGTTDTSAYTAPVKLGNNVQDMQMQLDGTLYQFPFPVSELLADAGQETKARCMKRMRMRDILTTLCAIWVKR